MWGRSLESNAVRFYLTTPIYYVNATPHIGHAYTTIAADIVVRHHRQRGDETFFLTGVDEHATKVFRVAEAEGLGPQEYVDRIAEVWRELPGRVGAEPDFFIRTSDEGHKRFVRDFLQRIYDNGDVYEGVYAGLYCVGCEAFKAESDLVDGKCPDHGDVEYIEEKNYFFRLSAYEDRLLALYKERPDFVLPRFRANEARSFIEQGLQDFSISRAGQPWGIPLPWDEDQVAYVWADALVNYLSALTYARPGTDLVPELWPAARHLMAKDILRFHCVYWPAMLMSAGYDVPQQIFVHGYLLMDDTKISKSLGNVIDPLPLADVYGSDAVRFWAIRSASFGQDGTASIDSLHERYERELGNDLGNLLSRTTAMIAQYRDGAVAQRDDNALADRLNALHTGVPSRFDAWEVTGALDAIWDVVRELNRHVERTQAVGAREGCLAERRARPGVVRPRRRFAQRRGRVVLLRARDRVGDPRCAGPTVRHVVGRGRAGTPARGNGHRARRAALPTHRARSRSDLVIDTHAHLDALDGSAHDVLARARAVGVTRVITIGTRIDSCRAALALARDEGGVFAALGIHPHEAGGPEADRVEELRDLLQDDRAVAVGETGLDHYRDYAPHDAQRRLFDAHLELASELGLPVVDPLACRRRRDRGSAPRLRRHGRPPLLLRARASARGARPGVLRLVRGERDLPQG